MKRLGWLLILVLVTGILPIQAQPQPENYLSVDNGSIIRFYKGAAGYDTLLKPDGTVFIQSQRYTVEYQQGAKWKQIMVPYQVSRNSEIKREYTDYLGTTGEVIYKQVNGSIKTDVVIRSSETRNYRIVWSLEGIRNTDYSLTENGVNFTGAKDWVMLDWSDAFNQYGDITDYTVTDSAGGRTLKVVFNIGTVKAGETKTLDPTLINSYWTQTGTYNLKTTHPSANAETSSIGILFNTTQSLYLAEAVFSLREINNPTGNGYATLYNVAAGVPTGVALATSEAVDVSTIGAAKANVTFKFTDGYLMAANTTYCIAYQNPAAGIDSTDYLRTYIGGGPSSGAYYSNGAWSTTTSDLLHSVSGVPSMLINTEQNATTTISKDTPAWINQTIFDWVGTGNLKNVTFTAYRKTDPTYNYSIQWIQATDTFSEASDIRNILTLNTGTSTALNITHTKLTMNITQTGGPDGLYNINVTTHNDDDNSDVDTYTDVYSFSYFNWIDEVYDFINSAFNQFGITAFMSQITTYINGLTGYFTSSLTRIITLVTLQFTVITEVWTFFSYWATEMIGIVLDFSEFWQSIISDTNSTFSNGLGNIWSLIGWNMWSQAAPLFLFLYWINSVGERAQQYRTSEFSIFIQDANTASLLMSYFFNVFTFVANTIIDRVYGLFDAIT